MDPVQHGGLGSGYTSNEHLGWKEWERKLLLFIKFVQEKPPSVPVPTFLVDYIDKKAGWAYILASSVLGQGLNESGKKLDEKQEEAVWRELWRIRRRIHVMDADYPWTKAEELEELLISAIAVPAGLVTGPCSVGVQAGA